MTWQTWDPVLLERVGQAADRVAWKYAVPHDDLRQEGRIHLELHHEKFQDMPEELILIDIARHLARLAKREHRQRGGRNPLPLEESHL